MKRSIAFAIGSAVLLVGGVAVAGGVISARADCAEPRVLLSQSQGKAIQAVETWIETKVLDDWKVAKPARIDYDFELQPKVLGRLAAGEGLPPALVQAKVTVYDDGARDPFFGTVLDAKAVRFYDIELTRNCAGGEWEVSKYKLVREETIEHGKHEKGGTGVPVVPQS